MCVGVWQDMCSELGEKAQRKKKCVTILGEWLPIIDKLNK